MIKSHIHEYSNNKKYCKLPNFNEEYHNVSLGYCPNGLNSNQAHNNVNNNSKTSGKAQSPNAHISLDSDKKLVKKNYLDTDDSDDYIPKYKSKNSKNANSSYSIHNKKEINHKIAIDKSSSLTNKLKSEITSFKSLINPIAFKNDNESEREQRIYNLEKTIHDLKQFNYELECKLDSVTQELIKAQSENETDKTLKNENRTILFDNQIIKGENAKLNEYLKNLENDYRVANNK